MRVHPKGLLVLLAVIAAFALALDVRLGIAAVVVAGLIDWTYIVAPFLGWSRDSGR